jgi:hypothetical protein
LGLVGLIAVFVDSSVNKIAGIGFRVVGAGKGRDGLIGSLEVDDLKLVECFVDAKDELIILLCEICAVACIAEVHGVGERAVLIEDGSDGTSGRYVQLLHGHREPRHKNQVVAQIADFSHCP